MTDIVIVSAARTAVGSFNGAFAATPAHELGKTAITAALQRAKIDAKEVSEVVLGQVLTANQGMNPARQASRAAGVPTKARRGRSTKCAARDCAPLSSATSSSRPAMPRLSSPAARRT